MTAYERLCAIRDITAHLKAALTLSDALAMTCRDHWRIELSVKVNLVLDIVPALPAKFYDPAPSMEIADPMAWTKVSGAQSAAQGEVEERARLAEASL